MSVIEFPPCAGSAGVKSTLAGAVVAVPLSSWMRLRFSHWLLACSSLRSSSIRLLMDFCGITRIRDTNIKLTYDLVCHLLLPATKRWTSPRVCRRLRCREGGSTPCGRRSESARGDSFLRNQCTYHSRISKWAKLTIL